MIRLFENVNPLVIDAVIIALLLLSVVFAVIRGIKKTFINVMDYLLFQTDVNLVFWKIEILLQYIDSNTLLLQFIPLILPIINNMTQILMLF